jgi:hypothetical protein
MTKYRFGTHGESADDDRGGYYFRPGTVSSWSAPFDKGELVFRPFPMISTTEPSGWEPYRWSSRHPEMPLEFGDWIRGYPAMCNAGSPSVSFLCWDPANPAVEDKKSTPGYVLHSAIRTAVSRGQDRPGWAATLEGRTGRGALLPRPTTLYFIQGALVQHGTQAYTPPKGLAAEDKPLAVVLKRSAGKALLAQLQLEAPGYAGDPDDFEHRYVNGDPVSLATGRFITIYTLGKDPRQARQAWQIGGPAQSQAAGDSNAKGYGAFLSPVFAGNPASMAAWEPFIRTKIRPWDQVLLIPTLEEQAAMLGDKFTPEMIMYAWADTHPEWVPAAVRNRASMPPHMVPGTSFGAPAAWQPAAPMAAAPPPWVQQQGPVSGYLQTADPPQQWQPQQAQQPWVPAQPQQPPQVPQVPVQQAWQPPQAPMQPPQQPLQAPVQQAWQPPQAPMQPPQQQWQPQQPPMQPVQSPSQPQWQPPQVPQAPAQQQWQPPQAPTQQPQQQWQPPQAPGAVVDSAVPTGGIPATALPPSTPMTVSPPEAIAPAPTPMPQLPQQGMLFDPAQPPPAFMMPQAPLCAVPQGSPTLPPAAEMNAAQAALYRAQQARRTS